MTLDRKRIFLLDDNISNVTIAQLLLERQGAKVFIARMGIDAVERLRKCAPVDAVLLDLMLYDGPSGYDIFQQIRQLEEFKGVPIVAVSAADASIAIPKAQALGFSGFISKPVDFRYFPQQVQRILAGEIIWYTQERF
jgi:CheY-like chemotaxis protein